MRGHVGCETSRSAGDVSEQERNAQLRSVVKASPAWFDHKGRKTTRDRRGTHDAGDICRLDQSEIPLAQQCDPGHRENS
jgi:hypothetical protein